MQPIEPRLRIDARHSVRGLELQLHGELDVDTRGTFIATVDGRGGGDVHVDASGVTFLDSSGLAALVIAADRTRADGDEIRVEAMSATVRALLTRTGLLGHLAAGDSDGDGGDAGP